MAATRRTSSGESRYVGSLPDRVRHLRRTRKLSQAALAELLGVVPSAVAQWEGRSATSPTVEHLARMAEVGGIAFEWLATGRGPMRIGDGDTPSVAAESFARDILEERLLLAFRKIPARKRESLVRWLEEFV
jgi:transcriptional regulator with XRE-family HTH domain